MLRLQSIALTRMRGIREGSLSGLREVNILVGRNNSGKSTIVEAISRLGAHYSRGGTDGKDLIGEPRTKFWAGIRNEGVDLAPTLWFQQDQTQTLAIEAKIGPADTGSPAASFRLTSKADSGGSITILDPPPPRQSGKLRMSPSEEFLDRLSVFRQQHATNARVELTLWSQLLATRLDKRLVQAFNDAFGLGAEGLQLLPEGKLMVLYADHSLPLDVQGDGPRSALRCLMMLSVLRDTMVLLEEPECYQHPGSLKRFALAVCQFAKSQNIQLLITTHSAECVSAFLDGAGHAQADGEVFHLKLEDGVLDARSLDPRTVATLRETGVDVRQLDLYA